ncbi:MAG: hypothetical protein EZS28_000386 [Streblomastix strix]|uniref:Uncharacterized protein n=1 Tax=Streblomastix strix TaxID=222440 RepID=A0A5J4XA79_9EUKA|nr:MAG: hypothetical protein EZS28_000386 [Streblomastix strix]
MKEMEQCLWNRQPVTLQMKELEQYVGNHQPLTLQMKKNKLYIDKQRIKIDRLEQNIENSIQRSKLYQKDNHIANTSEHTKSQQPVPIGKVIQNHRVGTPEQLNWNDTEQNSLTTVQQVKDN